MGLSDKQLNHFQNLLQELRTELIKANEFGSQAEEVVELDQTRLGRLSRMDALQAQAMSVETGRRRRLHLQEIDTALERIKAGDYGDCFECDELINPKRLEADPRTTLCIRCAEALEQAPK